MHIPVSRSVKKGLVVTEVSAIQATLSEICNDEVIDRFAEVWEDIGLEEGHRKDRRETIRKHLIEMLTEMLNEELALKQKLHDSVHTCAAEVQKLASELGKKATMVNSPHNPYSFINKPILEIFTSHSSLSLATLITLVFLQFTFSSHLLSMSLAICKFNAEALFCHYLSHQ